jgi:drug/metabolite transporter (DMT)-like permease
MNRLTSLLNSGNRSSAIAIVSVATLWQAIGTVIVSVSITPQTSLLVTFVAFLAAAIISLALLGRKGRLSTLASKLRSRRALAYLVAMNVVTALVFVSFYTAITLISPTAASVLDAGMGPAVVVIAMFSRNRRPGRVGAIVVPLVILGLSLAIALVDIAGRAGSFATVVGLCLASLTGICGASIVLLSRKLASLGFDASEVNATRFHLAWVVSGVGAMFMVGDVGSFSRDAWFLLTILAIACVALPLMFLQFGISKAPALSSALILSTLPALVFITQTVAYGQANAVVAILMAVLMVTSIASTMFQKSAADHSARERRKDRDSAFAPD